MKKLLSKETMGRKKIKFLFTDLTYLNHNYGAQGIAFPLMKQLNEYFDTEYTFVLPERYYKDDLSFSKKYNFSITTSPKPLIVLAKCHFYIYLLYNFARLLKGKRMITKREQEQYFALVEKVKESDVIIDLSGIEFIGNVSLKRRYLNCLGTISIQCLAEKYNKLYLKHTKSYGPFSDKIYNSLVRRQLNKLPFIFVRGKNNLEEIKKIHLKVPLYSFPDVSLFLEPESKEWALNYITKIGINPSKTIAGISPSAVIANIRTKNNSSSCGFDHIRLCKKIIKFYQSNYQQILLIPHSVGDGKDIRSCDLALSKKLYDELENKKNIFMIPDTELTYQQVRAIIGLLDFYVTSRYHSVSSALSMAVPVVSLSWHIKYEDIMSLFLDDFLTVNCRITDVNKALLLIKKYYYDREWFNKKEVFKKKRMVIQQIDRSINILADEIRKYTKCKNN